jgi:hypothetical protein
LVRGVRKRVVFLGMFPDNDAISCSAAGCQPFSESAAVVNAPQQIVNAPTVPVRRVGLFSVREQALIGRTLKGDFGHLFGFSANLERGRRGAARHTKVTLVINQSHFYGIGRG